MLFEEKPEKPTITQPYLRASSRPWICQQPEDGTQRQGGPH